MYFMLCRAYIVLYCTVRLHDRYREDVKKRVYVYCYAQLVAALLTPLLTTRYRAVRYDSSRSFSKTCLVLYIYKL
jgi:hypothetical protein